jgi:hypothetical protein
MSKRLLFMSIVVVPLWAGTVVRAHDVADPAPAPPATGQHGPYIVNNIHTHGNNIQSHGGAEPPREVEPPTVLAQTLQGMLAGGLVGTGAGYLTVHDADVQGPWRDVLLGTGIGALTGGSLGLVLGLIDGGLEGHSRASYVMRDMLCGSGVGALFGGTIGGLVALSSDDARDVLMGASIGVISGAVLGVVAGVVEGQWRARRARGRARAQLLPALRAGRDLSGRQVWMSGVSGHF